MRAYPHLTAACLISALLLARAVPAASQSFVAPPRSIADITAILDQEKPDPVRLAQMQADAERPPPVDADPAVLAAFYYERAVARQNLGRFQESIENCKAGIAVGQQRQDIDVTPLRQLLGFQYDWAGDINASLEVFEAIERDSHRPGRRWYLFNAYRWISFLNVLRGDLAVRESQSLAGVCRAQQRRSCPNRVQPWAPVRRARKAGRGGDRLSQGGAPF